MDSETDSKAGALKQRNKLITENSPFISTSSTNSNVEKDYVEIKPENKMSENSKSILAWCIKYFVSLFLGLLFGFAMEKAKVYEPIAIRQQMIFKRFIMLKMFLAAFATSTLSIFIVAIIFKKR